MEVPEHFTFERQRFWCSVLKVKQFCSWVRSRTRESTGTFTSQKRLAYLTFYFLAKSALKSQVLFHIIVITLLKT